jgi:Tc toxin complex TcA C-terminal TcB-binding domain/Neuraminidase-like domain/ABC toxin N-terminal region
MLSTLMDSTVSELKRDARLAFYLKYIVANDPSLVGRDIETPEDVYRYLAIDSEISSKIITSPVASAISSLQTFISNVSLNMEPGLLLSSIELDDWQQFYCQYPIWAANQLLSIYPENYIDPSLRLSKTDLFKDLEVDLMQTQLNEDNVQLAVFDYLNEFEKISNLQIVNGYQSHFDINQSDIYFIGRTRIQPYEYYWRKLDMTQRDPESPDIIYPTAWTSWKKIELPIVDAVHAVVRPIFFRGRLYIVWLELRDEEDPASSTSQEKKSIKRLHLKLGFKRYDDSWSSSQDYMLLEEATTSITETQIRALLVTVADIESLGPPEILIGIYGTAATFPIFYYIDELLTLTKHRIDVFRDYPFREDVIPIAMPITTAAYRPDKSEQHSDLMYASRAAFTLYAEMFNGGERGEILRLTLWTSVSGWTGGFDVDSHPSEDNRPPSPYPGMGVIILDYYHSDKLPDRKVVLDCWAHEYPAPYRYAFTVNLIPTPANYKDSTAYISETMDGIQLLSFATGQGLLQPIRVNTLFAKELIQRANAGIDMLLALYNQYPSLAYPIPFNSETGINVANDYLDLDFYGANGLYFWELFFYMPFLVAYNLNLQQRFDEATRWFHYLFNPLLGSKMCWRVRVLLSDANLELAIGLRLGGPTDPDNIAIAHPVHYRKTLFRYYISNIIDQGDAMYRQVTPDSLTAAKSYYMAALDLFGPRLVSSVRNEWEPLQLRETIEGQKNQSLLAFEQEFTEEMVVATMSHAGNDRYQAVVKHDPTINILSNGLFYKPINKELLALWNKIQNRLYNLRHNLSIDGKPLNLPLFAPPLNPKLLMMQRLQGQGLNTIPSAGALQIPHYRFSILIRQAQNAVDSLIQFGNNLISVFERRDNREWETLQTQQQQALLDFTVSLQEEAIALAEANNEGLAISKAAAEKRYEYYKKLAEDDVSARETLALNLFYGVEAAYGVSAIANLLGGFSDGFPNIFGIANGGTRWGAVFYGAAGASGNTAAILSTVSGALQTKDSYDRRRVEWEFQRDLADQDKELIDHQINMGELQLSTAETQLKQIEEQHVQAKEMLDFYSSRFTNQALYQWMSGQLFALYRQAYDVVTSLCFDAEKAWQYEIGDFDSLFIVPGAWNDLYKGLLAGETLKLYLQRMEQKYVERNDRKLEITKTFSLKQLMTEEIFNKDKLAGKLIFNLEEKYYDDDYPDHYLRQINSVSIFLPAVLGPYQDVKAILTQTSNSFKTASGEPMTNLRALQQICLSTGMDESGLFVLNFGDERYLPFEGTGAVSNWQLDFQNPTSDEQKRILESLTDVIVRIRYTAKTGRGSQAPKKRAAPKLLKKETKARDL